MTVRATRARRFAVALALPFAVLSWLLAVAAPAQAHRATEEIVDTARGTGNVVSFTFDDGPSPADTPRLLSVLRKHHVRAVFCLWGDHVIEHPRVARQIVAAGHVLCNHTMHHDDMSAWSVEQITADLVQTNAAIRRAVPGVADPVLPGPVRRLGSDTGRRGAARHAAAGLATGHRGLGPAGHRGTPASAAGGGHPGGGGAHARRRR